MFITNQRHDALGISAEIEQRYCIIGGWVHIMRGISDPSEDGFSICRLCATGMRKGEIHTRVSPDRLGVHRHSSSLADQIPATVDIIHTCRTTNKPFMKRTCEQ